MCPCSNLIQAHILAERAQLFSGGLDELTHGPPHEVSDDEAEKELRSQCQELKTRIKQVIGRPGPSLEQVTTVQERVDQLKYTIRAYAPCSLALDGKVRVRVGSPPIHRLNCILQLI